MSELEIIGTVLALVFVVFAIVMTGLQVLRDL